MLSHFSCVRRFVTLWTVAHQAPLCMGFSKQEYWSGLPFPPPGDLPNPGIKPVSVMSPALIGGFFTPCAICSYNVLNAILDILEDIDGSDTDPVHVNPWEKDKIPHGSGNKKVQRYKIISWWGAGRLPKGGDFGWNFNRWGGFGNTDKIISKQCKHTLKKVERVNSGGLSHT